MNLAVDVSIVDVVARTVFIFVASSPKFTPGFASWCGHFEKNWRFSWTGSHGPIADIPRLPSQPKDWRQDDYSKS
jgi:hypothetical protein